MENIEPLPSTQQQIDVDSRPLQPAMESTDSLVGMQLKSIAEQKRIAQLEHEIFTVGKQLDEKSEKFKDVQDQNVLLKDRLGTLEQEKLDAARFTESLVKSRDSLIQEKIGLQNDRLCLEKRQDELELQVSNLTNEKRRHLDDIDQLRNKSDQLFEERTELQTQIDGFQSEKALIAYDKEQWSREKEILLMSKQWYMNEITDREQKINELRIQLIKEQSEMQRELSMFDERTTELTAKAEQLQENLLEREDELNTVRDQFNKNKVLQQSIFETADAFRVAMREEDSEKLQNFARLYAEQSNAFLTEMANQHRKGFGDLRMMDMLQMVSDYHDYSLCEMSFNVWYQLSEYLYRCEDADFEELRCVFAPYVEKHILSVCKHCRVEPDSHELLDRNSEHADFRSKTQESVKDVIFIVGSVNLLKRLMEVLNSSDSWDQMEAILFIISAFVGNVAETDRSVIPLLLEAILKFPIMATHRQLLKTSVQMIGNLQNWLEFNWEYTERIFNWLASLFGLGGGILGLTVAECLEQLMERGWQEVQKRNFHNEYLATLNELLARVEQAQSSGQEMEQAAHHLLRASAHLINDLPAHQLCAGLGRLCAGPNARLGEINQKTLGQVHASQIASSSTLFEENKENGPDSWAKLQTDPVLWLDRLAGVWRILLPWQQQLAYKQMANERQEMPPECPWLTLCSNAMESALTTLQRHQSEQRVVEHSCRTIRFLIRSMGVQSVVFIEPLASQIMLTYGQFPHSCLLYLSSILVDEYGAMAHLQPGMLQMLDNLATRSLALLAADSENGLQNHPDTVDDLYRLAIRFVQRSPSILFSHPVVVQLFQGAIHGLVLNHQDANKSVTKFVLEIIAVANGKRGQALSKDITARVGQLLAENGPQLMLASVSAALFHLSNSLCKEMAEIVHELLKTDKQKAEQWLNFVCMQLPNDGGHSATPKQLNDFRVTVLESVRPYDILEAMRELRKFYA